ncbi:endonuclease/exonuclease/phosphatase family protein [Bacteroides fragilis]|uniref:endonuclease/exonuclease/phosphatase family protein n=1 Tax=Bacteroides TaxID=816 RepID=UPI0022A5AA32|nr:endonuclease/exonuclease/phosphatase family protein [Bacteroides fragilis]MCY6343934.1 endonuclease/exonuclease/phosphatase family protein [Bacteroides fragilis]MCZ2614687.1 endonuclease/exonuclease/phosphatase family protein [Bacteroides fragilis]MCZ2624024.1 endonuclease/exonuclease/phosphatase family protein [Bacteroides fragilis]MCZ2670641.1 endonuclease/exonuclease/phosphatase family protein [Bacteroides fragilis]
MKKLIIAFGFLVLLSVGVRAQEHKDGLYSVAFYNLENLFDTIHDAGKNDYEYLPDAAKGWNSEKYHSKLNKLSKVLGELSRDKVLAGPAAIGVAEVENRNVLEDLIRQPEMAAGGYRYIHYEGPDKRGIDCALLYDPKQFTPRTTALVLSTPFEGDTIHKTRGFLIVGGELAGDKVCMIVNHWPSRGAEEPVRMHAAMQVKALKDSLMRSDKDLKLIIMGDLNDDPMDQSLAVLGAKKHVEDMTEDDLYNPWWVTLEDKGVGTLLYRGKWNLFDQIIISPSLLQAAKGLKYDHNEVFLREYLFQQEGRYKGSPLRTYGGKVWLDGYSDHLPTIIYMRKQ